MDASLRDLAVRMEHAGGALVAFVVNPTVWGLVKEWVLGSSCPVEKTREARKLCPVASRRMAPVSVCAHPRTRLGMARASCPADGWRADGHLLLEASFESEGRGI